MILDNWIKCVEGDYRYVRKQFDSSYQATEEDEDRWFEIYDGYIQKYGLNDMYLRLLKIMQKKALIELKYVMTRDPFANTEIAIQEAKLRQALNNKGSNLSIKQSLIYLSKWMGGKMINTREITAEQYFDLLEEYGKHH